MCVLHTAAILTTRGLDIAAQQGNVNNSVKPFNPERYAALSIASGAQTSEIIAQVGALIKSKPDRRYPPWPARRPPGADGTATSR